MRIRPDDVEEVIRLRHAVAAVAEVIGTPEQASSERGWATLGVHRVDAGRSLRRLVDHAQHAGSGDLDEVDVVVVMR